MNKEIKKRIIRSSIITILGFIIFSSIFIFKDVFTDNQISYISGFCSGLVIVGIIILIKTVFALSGADKGKKLSDSLKDERLISINNEACAITFRITTLIIAISSTILMVLEFEKEGMIAAIIVGISTLIYLISYFILNINR